jgi:hypothetical protein
VDDEPGYSPEEIERGDDRPWHMWPWGCLAFTLAAIALVLLLSLAKRFF